MISQFSRVELIAYSRSQRREQGADLVVLQHLVETRLLDVENLASQRKNRLKSSVSTLLCAPSRTVALDDIQLGLGRVALGAIGQLARQTEALQAALALHQLARLARRLPRPRSHDALLDDALGRLRVLLQKGAEGLVDDG